MPLNEELIKDLTDIFFHKKEGWEETIDYNLDNMSELDFEVIPEDAKTIDEIEEVIATIDVMGTQTYTFSRKEK
ncbi:MAG: hypothetical protein PVG65_01425 [Candidatus Thorarchaeota archaeon]|jgi:hypothetical protein